MAAAAAGRARPNVLLILIDDCPPDVISVRSRQAVPTPGMQRLARRGITFTCGYCAAPACGPSRTALLTGLSPSTTGVYQNDQSFRNARNWVRSLVTLPEHFKAHGYRTAGFGKVFHSGEQTAQNRHAFTEGDFSPLEGKEDVALGQYVPAARKITGSESGYTWGPLPDDFDREDPARMQQDTRHTNRAIQLIEESGAAGRPFFCALGLYRPHVHWYVPQRYYDLFPPEQIQPPAGLKWDDLDDLPPAALWFLRAPTFPNIYLQGYWRRALQALYASIAYVDEQIARVLNALDRSPARSNTIVILLGDNGWHTGQKHRFGKFALWELACRVPYVISVPGVPPRVAPEPVSMIDIYPTLNALCGLGKPPGPDLEGLDLSEVLRNPAGRRGRPVLSTMGPGNHSLRSERYRYIRYSNGDEELYDHTKDPHEWTNLACDPGTAALRREFARLLPTVNAPDLYETPWTKRWDAWRSAPLARFPD